MPLFPHAIGFGEPGGDFVIDLVDVLEAEGVEMIPRRKGLEPAKAWVFQAPRKNHMAVHPVSSNDKGRKAHPNLKSDPRFLGQDNDRPVLFRDRQQFIEHGAHGFRFAGKMRSERMSTAGVGLISIRELPSAIRAAPHRWIGRFDGGCLPSRLNRHSNIEWSRRRGTRST
jgi:hypothetical protein